jgi:hypothetical protein
MKLSEFAKLIEGLTQEQRAAWLLVLTGKAASERKDHFCMASRGYETASLVRLSTDRLLNIADDQDTSVGTRKTLADIVNVLEIVEERIDELRAFIEERQKQP